MSTIIRAYDELLESKKTGQTVEASGDGLYFQKQQEYPDEVARWIWEDMPMFFAGVMGMVGGK